MGADLGHISNPNLVWHSHVEATLHQIWGWWLRTIFGLFPMTTPGPASLDTVNPPQSRNAMLTAANALSV